MPREGMKNGDVFVFPAKGTYARIPLKESGDGSFSFKMVELKGEDGEPFRLFFINPTREQGMQRSSP